MATIYKTPGVYVEEIPKFPPSVAAVDTAIPAFIGYTEKAVDRVGDDLTLKPKRIESLVEFEQYFGGPQPETEITVTVEEVNEPAPGKPVGCHGDRGPRRDATARSTSSTTRCSCSTPTAASRATSSRSARTRRRGDGPRRSASSRPALTRWPRSTSRP